MQDADPTMFYLFLAYLAVCALGRIVRGPNPHGATQTIAYYLPHRVRTAQRENNLRVQQWENSQAPCFELGCRAICLLLTFGKWDGFETEAVTRKAAQEFLETGKTQSEPKGIAVQGWHVGLFVACLIVPAAVIFVLN